MCARSSAVISFTVFARSGEWGMKVMQIADICEAAALCSGVAPFTSRHVACGVFVQAPREFARKCRSTLSLALRSQALRGTISSSPMPKSRNLSMHHCTCRRAAEGTMSPPLEGDR